jgi:hypothetical protein
MHLIGNHIRSLTAQELIIEGTSYVAGMLAWLMFPCGVSLALSLGWLSWTQWHEHPGVGLVVLVIIIPLCVVVAWTPFSSDTVIRRIIRVSLVDKTVSVIRYDAVGRPHTTVRPLDQPIELVLRTRSPHSGGPAWTYQMVGLRYDNGDILDLFDGPPTLRAGTTRTANIIAVLRQFLPLMESSVSVRKANQSSTKQKH